MSTPLSPKKIGKWKINISKGRKGKGLGNKNALGNSFKLTREQKRKISLAHLGVKQSMKFRKKMSEIAKVRTYSLETRKKMSETHKRIGNRPPIMKGKDNPRWLGGKSFEPYTYEFNETLKEKIRKRDNYRCQLCGVTQKKHIKKVGDKLYIHHIDYDKRNCDLENLITTCVRCNSIANFGRDKWITFFKDKLCQVH